MTLSTHVLDLVAGVPAAGVAVRYETFDVAWRTAGRGRTDDDGRVSELAPAGLGRGLHRLTFQTGAYFADRELPSFHPEVVVVFEVTEPSDHHHVPLLVSPFGYTTYRGS